MSESKNFNGWRERDRRSFLQWSLATGLGLHSLDLVGAAEQRCCPPITAEPACHPFTPERVIVMTAKGGDGWEGRDYRLEAALRASLNERFNLSAGKLDLIVRLMRLMTDYYQSPELFLPWATGLAWRESLGSTAVGSGFGLLHQFQDGGLLQLMTPPVDWWLVLFPEGIDWESWEREPVYGMIGHVFPPHHCRHPGMKLRTYCLTTAIGRVIGASHWARIAKLDRLTAAQAVNQVVVPSGNEELQKIADMAHG